MVLLDVTGTRMTGSNTTQLQDGVLPPDRWLGSGGASNESFRCVSMPANHRLATLATTKEASKERCALLSQYKVVRRRRRTNPRRAAPQDYLPVHPTVSVPPESA
jgi:hypothetical protein